MTHLLRKNVLQQPQQTLQSLQVLRAIAALLVVFSHIRHKHLQNTPDASHFLDWMSVGPYGVDIFFVISGFIIAYITPVTAYTFTDVKNFMARRLIRVVPLYWVVTLVALAAWLYDPGKVNSTAPHLTRIWESFLLLPTDGRYLYQTGWTLSYEMYFYALFGLTMLFGRFQFRVLVTYLVAAIAVGLILQPGTDQPFMYMFTRDKLLEFLAGFLFCHTARYMIGKRPLTGIYLVSIGLVLIAIKAFTESQIAEVAYVWGIPAMCIVFGMLMLEKAVKWPAFMLRLGEASYALYLTHSFVMAAGAIIWYRIFDTSLASNIGFMVASLTASVILAFLTNTWLEKPMTIWLNNKWKARNTKVPVPVAAAE
ncbi:MAG TPA: acyltransferase [Rhizobiales bacterium]|nr:acyltransferase [Hyphomicrobiales bacterium]